MWVAINTDKLACMLELIPLQDCNNDDARGTFRIKDAINNLAHQANQCLIKLFHALVVDFKKICDGCDGHI